jgi:hypothetical protein
MGEALVRQLRNVSFVAKLSVNFAPTHSQSFDSYIGRKAHIELLENVAMIRMILVRYDNLFK